MTTYVFDVDGTLTPHRLPATQEFIDFFLEWSSGKQFYLSTGSDFEKTKEQLPEEIINSAKGTFCCMGNELYIPGNPEPVYSHEFIPTPDLVAVLRKHLKESPFPLRTGNHIERRPGMLNFSVVGRNATTEQREIYFEHDKIAQERKNLVNFLSGIFSDFDFVVGGMISIDIYPSGHDKSQSIRWIAENDPDASITYIGDRVFPGGNDYAVVGEFERQGAGNYHNVDNWRETIEILKDSDLVKNKDAL